MHSGQAEDSRNPVPVDLVANHRLVEAAQLTSAPVESPQSACAYPVFPRASHAMAWSQEVALDCSTERSLSSCRFAWNACCSEQDCCSSNSLCTYVRSMPMVARLLAEWFLLMLACNMKYGQSGCGVMTTWVKALEQAAG